MVNLSQKIYNYHLLRLDVCGEVSLDEKDDYHDEKREEDDGLLEQGHAHLQVDHLGATVQLSRAGSTSRRHFDGLVSFNKIDLIK
jgi:hypothetical protein